jgi:hypothetical protein
MVDGDTIEVSRGSREDAVVATGPAMRRIWRAFIGAERRRAAAGWLPAVVCKQPIDHALSRRTGGAVIRRALGGRRRGPTSAVGDLHDSI